VKNQDYHHYKGKDMSFFKFPDEDLVKIGPGLSEREFEIIRLVESGLGSKEIAEKLFLSVHTVNTHRKNILEKTGKAQISDLIYDFKEQGLL
jgi:DNA-binding NarL/FixJ family response regulator